ncbi:hypothetical protein MuYL_4459 [Mucilaginibacter xinganensis]|uniref:Uncharacterized protein n=1 Tax=Mucilaginibacter xinganensis TaxID=1234841 RepID=A0A223P306_9SPHI|nr:hypothetical protein MuYL_4459 [Mucilaginibacter xinganensis]
MIINDLFFFLYFTRFPACLWPFNVSKLLLFFFLNFNW